MARKPSAKKTVSEAENKKAIRNLEHIKKQLEGDDKAAVQAVVDVLKRHAKFGMRYPK